VSVRELGNCHTLILSANHSITNKSLEKLGNCKILNLSRIGNTTINAEGTKFLRNCYSVNFVSTEINNDAIYELRNCPSLFITSKNLTKELLHELNCKEVFLHGPELDDEIKNLKKCKCKFSRY
jgi:hypothetical protein